MHGNLFAVSVFQGFEQGDPVFVASAPGVIAKLYLVGIGADDGNRLQAFGVEGQQVVFVFQPAEERQAAMKEAMETFVPVLQEEANPAG